MAEEPGIMAVILEYLVPVLIMGLILAIFFIAKHFIIKRFGHLFKGASKSSKSQETATQKDQQDDRQANQEPAKKTPQNKPVQAQDDRPDREIVKAADAELSRAQQLMLQFDNFVEQNRVDPPDEVAQNYEDAQRCMEIAINSYLENEDMTGSNKFEAALRYLKEASRLIDDCGHKYEQYLQKTIKTRQ